MNNVAKLKLGPYEPIDTVVINLYPKMEKDMDYIREEEYFLMVDEINRKCETTNCKLSGLTHTSTNIRPHGLYLNNVPSTSISHWIMKLFTRGHNTHCGQCDLIMKAEHDIVALPHVLTLHLPQVEFTYDVDNEMVLNNEKYELCSVIYFGHGHFITRSMVNGVAKEYDGMKNEGKLRILNEASAK